MNNNLKDINYQLNNTQEIDEKSVNKVRIIFYWISKLIFLTSILCICYWIFSSERYVSEATILIQNTEQITSRDFDVTTLFNGMNTTNKSDQLLLSEYLLSVDMLKKLDEALNLRSHYSDNRWDIASRMWIGKYYIEWFHQYYLSRVTISFDEYSGVLHIRAQAYDPKMSYNIAKLLVEDGEKFMNEMNHALIRSQIKFLEKQVINAQEQVLQASKDLLNFQNNKGLVSPTTTVESIQSIISSLENQRTKLEMQLASLPKNLEKNHPTKKSLKKSISAIENQIKQEQVKLASKSGKSLNLLMEEEQLLQIELNFKQDIYKTSLAALEKGKMDAARSLKKVSILQQPILPEYALQPQRLYGIIVTIFLTFILIGITTLIKYIILDHVG